MSLSWGPERAAAQVREHAVRDVVDRGIPTVGAAATWGVQVADVERWVERAQAGGPGATPNAAT